MLAWPAKSLKKVLNFFLKSIKRRERFPALAPGQ
jgi:hypothetical protein